MSEQGTTTTEKDTTTTETVDPWKVLGSKSSNGKCISEKPECDQ